MPNERVVGWVFFSFSLDSLSSVQEFLPLLPELLFLICAMMLTQILLIKSFACLTHRFGIGKTRASQSSGMYVYERISDLKNIVVILANHLWSFFLPPFPLRYQSFIRLPDFQIGISHINLCKCSLITSAVSVKYNHTLL